MRVTSWSLLFFCCLAAAGCKKTKTTDELVGDLGSGSEPERVAAVRLLPERKADAAKIIPAMIESLKDTQNDVRLSAAIGLGSFGPEAAAAIPALQAATKDRDGARPPGQPASHCLAHFFIRVATAERHGQCAGK